MKKQKKVKPALTLEDVSRSYRYRQAEIKAGKRVVSSAKEAMELKNDLNARMEVHMAKAQIVEAESFKELGSFLIQ